MIQADDAFGGRFDLRGATMYTDALLHEPELENVTVELADSSYFQVETDGIASRTLTLTLRRNAVVGRFDVVVQATRAEATLLGNAAQVRKQGEASGFVTVVADFGLPRTVSSVGVVADSALMLKSLRSWTGAQFAEPTFWHFMTAVPPSDTKRAIFPEVRTERLMINVIGESDVAVIANQIWVHLPDLPSDLELRIGSSAPVFTSPGPVQPNARGFDAQARQTVALASALNALAGDPTDDTEQTLSLVLTSRVPGRLQLTEDTATTVIRHLARIDLGPEGRRDLVFDAEGVQDFVLALPAWVDAVEQVSLTLAAKLSADRVVPPVGPPVAPIAGDASGAAVAELVLDVDHSACVRLPAQTRLVEMTAVRLPLRADEGGAEARVVLLEGSAESGEPGPPIDEATSRPVTLPEGAEDTDAWTTFSFPQPVALRDDTRPWVAVALSRGRVFWTLGRFEDAAQAPAVRRGAITGPWRTLPALLAGAPGIGGRVRVVGRATADRPVAPVIVNVTGATAGAGRELEATPTAKGARVDWRLADPAALVTPLVAGGQGTVRLHIISRVSGTVTIRDVDVLATRRADMP